MDQAMTLRDNIVTLSEVIDLWQAGDVRARFQIRQAEPADQRFIVMQVDVPHLQLLLAGVDCHICVKDGFQRKCEHARCFLVGREIALPDRIDDNVGITFDGGFFAAAASMLRGSWYDDDVNFG